MLGELSVIKYNKIIISFGEAHFAAQCLGEAIIDNSNKLRGQYACAFSLNYKIILILRVYHVHHLHIFIYVCAHIL